AHGNVDRLLAEELFQHAEFCVVQRERDDRILVPAALFLHVERMAQLLADPLRLQPIRTDHDSVCRRVLNRLLYLLPERITTAKFTRVDPHVLTEIAERLLEIAHKAVVSRAVRNKELAHIRLYISAA